MFYRRKVILALLQVFEDELDKIHFQKLLFLFTRKQVKPVYDFVPYNYGCFSYSAYADVNAMVKREFLSETDTKMIKKDMNDYIGQLNREDEEILRQIKSEYGNKNVSSVMKHTYIEFPYYAIKSKVAEERLSYNEFEKVKEAIPLGNKTILFTLGYEGISIEEYLNRLIKNDIKLLVDVRKNAQSMKYGFTKSRLKKYCESVGIDYLHIPEVGIETDKREKLETFEDYRNLFEEYKQNNLLKTVELQKTILNLLNRYERIALTCFEADPDYCHRKHLAEAISRLKGFNYEVKHI